MSDSQCSKTDIRCYNHEGTFCIDYHPEWPARVFHTCLVIPTSKKIYVKKVLHCVLHSPWQLFQMFLLLKQNLQMPLFRKLKHVEVRKLSQSVNISRPTCQLCYMAGIFLHLVQPRNLYQLVKSISSTNWNCVWHGNIKQLYSQVQNGYKVCGKRMKITLSIQLQCHGYSFPKPNLMCKITMWNGVTHYLWRNIFHKYINHVTNVLVHIL
jgi:hypothetical protein